MSSSTTATTSSPPACCGRKDGQGCVCRNEATCSCGKKSAGACDCEKSSQENAVKGATCSCGMCYVFFFCDIVLSRARMLVEAMECVAGIVS